MGKKYKECPQILGFPFVAQKSSFKNQALLLLYPYGALTSCKKLEKTNEQSLKYQKTDQRTDHRTDHGRTGAITKDILWRTRSPK